MKIYSLERRQDRYIILYMFKIHIGANFGLVPEYNMRTKTRYVSKVNRRASSAAQRLRRASFLAKGLQLFNLLLAELRELLHLQPSQMELAVESFKRKLDKWLQLIPDKPTTERLTQRRAATSNALACQFNQQQETIRRKWREVRI